MPEANLTKAGVAPFVPCLFFVRTIKISSYIVGICIMKSIYLILCTVGLELCMTGYRPTGLEEIIVADWLD